MIKQKLATKLFLLLVIIVFSLTLFPVAGMAASKPAPPKGLKGSALSTSSIKLSWTKVSSAKNYIVYKKSGSKFVKIASPKKNSYTVKKLKAGTKYSFKVAVKTSAGTSKQSKAVTVKTKMPSGPAAHAFSPYSCSTSGSDITITYRRNYYQNATGIVSYKLYYKKLGESAWTYASQAPSVLTSTADVFLTVTVPQGSVISVAASSVDSVQEGPKSSSGFFAALPWTPPFPGQGINNFKCEEPPSSQYMVSPYTCTISWMPLTAASGYDVYMNNTGSFPMSMNEMKLVKDVGTATFYTLNINDTAKAGLHNPGWYLSYYVYVTSYVIVNGTKYESCFSTTGKTWGQGGTTYW